VMEFFSEVKNLINEELTAEFEAMRNGILKIVSQRGLKNIIEQTLQKSCEALQNRCLDRFQENFQIFEVYSWRNILTRSQERTEESDKIDDEINNLREQQLKAILESTYLSTSLQQKEELLKAIQRLHPTIKTVEVTDDTIKSISEQQENLKVLTESAYVVTDHLLELKAKSDRKRALADIQVVDVKDLQVVKKMIR